jgi:pilus assembly protein CpaE
MHRVLLISSDAALGEQAKRALDSVATIMRVDPVSDNVVENSRQFDPAVIIVDSDARTGAQTTYERLVAIRQWLGAETPLIVVGNEMGAQLILTAMRAGAQDFIDRDANDREFRNVMLRHLAGRSSGGKQERGRMVSILSATPCDENRDLAVNIGCTLAAARPQDGVILVDLSLPASDMGISLGIDLQFRVCDAVKEIARLDRALLDGALARCPRSGLYVLPLSLYGDDEGWAVDMQDLRALLEMLQSLYEVVIVYCGPFSRHEELIGLPNARSAVFVACNQRFTSIKATGEILRTVRALRSSAAEPILAVHEFAPTLTPSFAEICTALGTQRAVLLPVRWAALADSVNRGLPLALAGPSEYVDHLTRCLAENDLMPHGRIEHEGETQVRSWARKLMGILP